MVLHCLYFACLGLIFLWCDTLSKRLWYFYGVPQSNFLNWCAMPLSFTNFQSQSHFCTIYYAFLQRFWWLCLCAIIFTPMNFHIGMISVVNASYRLVHHLTGHGHSHPLHSVGWSCYRSFSGKYMTCLRVSILFQEQTNWSVYSTAIEVARLAIVCAFLFWIMVLYYSPRPKSG